MSAETFIPKNATVKHFHINIDKYVDETTGLVTKGEVVVLELTNGDTLFSPLSAISRAMSAMLEKKDLFLLRRANVEYVVGNRVLGAKFSWRPSDKREFIATTAGEFRSIESIEPVDANFAALNMLPAYETMRDRTAEYTGDIVEPNADEDEESTPEGAETVEAVVVAKTAKKK